MCCTHHIALYITCSLYGYKYANCENKFREIRQNLSIAKLAHFDLSNRENLYLLMPTLYFQ